jgi:hypothetical protein
MTYRLCLSLCMIQFWSLRFWVRVLGQGLVAGLDLFWFRLILSLAVIPQIQYSKQIPSYFFSSSRHYHISFYPVRYFEHKSRIWTRNFVFLYGNLGKLSTIFVFIRFLENVNIKELSVLKVNLFVILKFRTSLYFRVNISHFIYLK